MKLPSLMVLRLQLEANELRKLFWCLDQSHVATHIIKIDFLDTDFISVLETVPGMLEALEMISEVY